MRINIHRGQHQIGGSIVEIATEKVRIVLDVGQNLDESASREVPLIDGLFQGSCKYDGVFISHYHEDHLGLMDNLLEGIPVFMGEVSYKMVKAAYDYRGREVNFEPEMLHHLEEKVIGDMRILPIRCDYSAFDSYMFLIEADGKSVLYTGDFRANGRQDFEELLANIPNVDALIIEGTKLALDGQQNIMEEKLELIALGALEKYKGPAFIMMSPMNVDRLTTAYNVAEKSGRIFLEDIYTASVAAAAGSDIPQPNGVKPARVFTTGGEKQYERLSQFGKAKIGKKAIAKSNFLMCIRQSMRNYLEKLNELCSFENGILFFAMWSDYLERPDMDEFVKFMESKGVNLHKLHTSGHADVMTIEQLIAKCNPKVLIPIHTESDEWFKKYEESCEVVYDCIDYDV